MRPQINYNFKGEDHDQFNMKTLVHEITDTNPRLLDVKTGFDAIQEKLDQSAYQDSMGVADKLDNWLEAMSIGADREKEMLKRSSRRGAGRGSSMAQRYADEDDNMMRARQAQRRKGQGQRKQQQKAQNGDAERQNEQQQHQNKMSEEERLQRREDIENRYKEDFQKADAMQADFAARNAADISFGGGMGFAK